MAKQLSPAADHGDLPTQVQHPIHPGHSLTLVPDDDGVGFRCNGCKMRGAGARYECGRGAACGLRLHIRCALAPAEREIGGNMFVLLHKPLDGQKRRLCDACGDSATGFAYYCPSLDHDVHPCCADLPEFLDLAGVFLQLRMTDPKRRCPICPEKKKNRGCWSYRSVHGCGGDDDVFLHVACARDLARDSFTDVTGTGSVVVHGSVGGSGDDDMFLPVARARDLACDGGSFTKASLANAMAARASRTTRTGSVVVDRRSDQEMVMVKASTLRALLREGQGRGHKRHGRWLKILSFIGQVVIGIIFGNPTGMFVEIGKALFFGDV